MLEQDDIDHLRLAAESADIGALNDIVKKYQELTRRLQPYIDAFTNALKADPEANYKRLPEYTRLLDTIESELEDFSSYLAITVKAEAERASGDGVGAGLALLLVALGLSQEQAELINPQDDTVLDVLAGYLEDGSPLMERIRGMAGTGAELVREIITEGVVLGRNPLTIANEIIERGLGVGLTNAMRWTRTVQLYSYRWGTAAIYQANDEIIKGWIWWAELDDSVCMSCVSLHGKVFGLEEGVANDHYNGRCAMIPYIPNATDQYANPNAGQEWFDGLSEQQQRDLMGAGKYEAYQAGQFEFNQLSKFHESDVYGTMRVETSLQELVNESE